jgi:hypothetical protein
MRLLTPKKLLLGAVFFGLVVLMVVAVLREVAAPEQETVATNAAFGGLSDRPPMTATEEAYAHALWPIHARVKQSAVKMTFAGLAYKLGDIRREDLKARIAPLMIDFEQTLIEAQQLQPPESADELHRQYLEAIALYRDASRILARGDVSQGDADLIRAQEMSNRAATLTLKVGDTLWPGEYKPN